MMKERTFILQATIPANAPANTIVPVSITVDPIEGPKNTQQVPQQQSWVVSDIYVTGSPAVDGIITLFKNRDIIVGATAPISTTLVTNPSRTTISKKVYGPTEVMSATYTTLAANGATAATVTAYAKVVIFE